MLATVVFVTLAYFYEYTPERSADDEVEHEISKERITTTNFSDNLNKCAVNPTYEDLGIASDKI
jgi:hypothetical protein